MQLLVKPKDNAPEPDSILIVMTEDLSKPSELEVEMTPEQASQVGARLIEWAGIVGFLNAQRGPEASVPEVSP